MCIQTLRSIGKARQGTFGQIPKNAASRREALASQLDSLVAREIALNADLTCAQDNKLAEQNGDVDCQGRKTAQGRGDRYDSYVEEAKRLEAALTALATEKAKVDADLAATVNTSSRTDTAMSAVSQRLAALAAQSAGLQAKLSVLRADSAEMVRVRAEADPAFIPFADGLLQRRDALAALLDEHPAMKVDAFALNGALMLLDLFGLIGPLLTGTPSLLALHTVLRHRRMAMEIAADAAESVLKAQERLLKATAAADQAARNHRFANEAREAFDAVQSRSGDAGSDTRH